MKQLIYEYTEKIEARKLFANQLVDGLNQVLTRFKSKHNHFGQTISEDFAYQLVSQPVETFDELLAVNSPIKPVAGKPLDIVALAKLVNIDRPAWLNDCKILVPGSVSQYSRQGTTAIYKLNDAHRPLVSWQDDRFVLNESALAEQLEAYKVYASTPEQIAEVEYWQNLAGSLNELIRRKMLDSMDCNQIRQTIPMLTVISTPTGPNGQDKTFSFTPDAEKLAKRITELAMN